MFQLLNDFSPGLFIMQTILLLVVILLLRKFAWKPILDALTAREEGIENALNMAENARKEIAALEAKNDNLLKEARAERDAMIKEAKETGVRMVEEAKQKAKEESEKIISQAQAAITAEKNVALAELKNQVANMALEIAEKVIQGQMTSDEKQREVANKFAEEISLN
ncbi:MAG: F0F1 ATP synthase subunit B [Crocinitomicaceae bacterium]|nr:F0F1 ATP synthase subunit B [Crocinitomicaceae bacterium]